VLHNEADSDVTVLVDTSKAQHRYTTNSLFVTIMCHLYLLLRSLKSVTLFFLFICYRQVLDVLFHRHSLEETHYDEPHVDLK
jgi:hypothetical protein